MSDFFNFFLFPFGFVVFFFLFLLFFCLVFALPDKISWDTSPKRRHLTLLACSVHCQCVHTILQTNIYCQFFMPSCRPTYLLPIFVILQTNCNCQFFYASLPTTSNCQFFYAISQTNRNCQFFSAILQTNINCQFFRAVLLTNIRGLGKAISIVTRPKSPLPLPPRDK